MGKQRRKGNAQCASSSKAAELLQSSGNFVPLIGLEGLQIPSLDNNDILSDEYGSVSPDIRIIFKKLSKRDAMTREKGIKETLEMVEKLPISELKPMFTYFSGLYPRLVTDSMPMIRSHANLTLMCFFKNLKKEAEGPALKSVIPFLLFSLGDAHAASRAAERLLCECFSGEKREALITTFAKPTLNLALEIVGRKHKLVQPQQVTSDEPDDLRQSRLISQGLATIEMLLEENSKLSQLLIENFTQVTTISALSKISTNIKIALFALLKRLVQIDCEPFFDSKIMTLILANLDSAEWILCRNSFECFLTLARNERFRDVCKVEKAVVPKFLSMIRKKSEHWNVLQSSLLPSFVVICKALPQESAQKWIHSAIDSFFDGDLPSHLMTQWSIAFIEVMGWCIKTHLQNADISSFLFKKTLEFINIVVKSASAGEKTIQLTADFILSICRINEDNEDLAHFKGLLTLNLLNELPQTVALVDILLAKWDDLCISAIKFPDVPEEVLINALCVDLRMAQAKVENLADLLLRRLCESQSRKSDLLEILCVLITEHNAKNVLNEFIQNSPANCYLFLGISPQLIRKTFDEKICTDIVTTIVEGILSNEFALPSNVDVIRRTVTWIFDLGHICGENFIWRRFLDICLKKASCVSDFSLNLLNGLFIDNKIPEELEHSVALDIFKVILLNSSASLPMGNFTDKQMAVNLLSRLKIDVNDFVDVLELLLNSSETDYESAKAIGSTLRTLKFSNTTSLSFLPNEVNVRSLAKILERKYLRDMLLEPNAYFFSLLPARLELFETRGENNEKCVVDNAFRDLFRVAKRALVTQELLETPSITANAGDIFAASRVYIWLTRVFLEFFINKSFSLEKSEILRQFLLKMNEYEILEAYLLDAVKLFLPTDPPVAEKRKSDEEEIYFPISILFALSHTHNNRSVLGKGQIAGTASLNEFLKSTFLAHCPSLAFTVALNSSEDIPILLDASSSNNNANNGSSSLGASSLGGRSHAYWGGPYESEGVRVRRWIYEFERSDAVFTSENRVAHFMKLASFIQLKGFDEWLFTLQSDNLARDALSCELLRLFEKLIPFLHEADKWVKDFINCGFMTAIQSCTDKIFGLFATRSNEDETMLFVMAQLCIRLFEKYDDYVMSNSASDDEGQFNVRQEWTEFFVDQAINSMFSWFLTLTSGSDLFPASFTLELCRLIHFIDRRRIGVADSLVEFPKGGKSADMRLFDEISATFFSSYHTKKREILSATAKLLLSERVEIQFAARKIFESNLSLMFDYENSVAHASPSNLTDDGFDVDEGTEESNRVEFKLPNFLSAIFKREFPFPSSTVDTNTKQLNRGISIVLLAWDAFVRFMGDGAMDASWRVYICDALSTCVLDDTLSILVGALPDSPSAIGSNVFTEELDLHSQTKFNFEKFVCNLYYRSLITVPALVRQWYLLLTKNVAFAINKYTQKFVSPAVIAHEMTRIGGGNSADATRPSTSTRRFGRLEVKVMAAVNEVVASYRFDDATIRIQIALPADFPLKFANVTSERKIVREDLHRKWLLQLESFLGHENGSLLDGILQWKRNIDRHLDGVEDCTICMLTVSLTNHQLPRIRCRQCRNKFHGDCLYKWFKTSSNTSCPLCRGNFVR